MFGLLPLWAKALIVAAIVSAVAAAFAAFVHHERDVGRDEVRAEWKADRARWQAALDKQKTEAAQTLAAETGKTLEAERRLGEFRNAREKTDANNEAVVATLSRKLATVRLRDPYATAPRCGESGGSTQGATGTAAADRPGDTAGADGFISVQLSDLLRAKLRRADEVNDAYASCRSTAISDRDALTVKP